MNIQKVKEAIVHIISQPNEFLFTAKYLREYFQESLAELDNPVDVDARIIARDISTGALEYAEYWDNIVTKLIQQYAEQYHAKKCAECTQKKAPYKLFGVD